MVVDNDSATSWIPNIMPDETVKTGHHSDEKTYHSRDRHTKSRIFSRPSVALFLLMLLLTISVSRAQYMTDETALSPSSRPTSIETTSPTSQSLETSQSPSVAPMALKSTTTFQPTNVEGDPTISTLLPTAEECANNPDFLVDFYDFENCNWNLLRLPCEDIRVSCQDFGNLGSAMDHCCKCKYRCQGVCRDDTGYWNVWPPSFNFSDCGHCPDCGDIWQLDHDADSAGGSTSITVAILFGVIFGMALWVRIVYYCHGDRRNVQQTMSARRQEQRENNTQGLSEEERNNARYEIFLTNFHFQKVLKDKSNITADSLRSGPASKDDDQEGATTKNDDEIVVLENVGQTSLSDCLSNWRKPSAKDECCICLECYNEGEMICAPITKSCSHVFHERCILEWLKAKDNCPICRTRLLED